MPAITIAADPSKPVLDGYLALPSSGAGPWPGVVVVHEGTGLNDDVRRHADRFAAAGYVAVIPDLYTGGSAWRCMLSTIRALLRGRGQAFDDIDAARRWLAARPDCSGPVGVAGFCMGGGFALLCAARGFAASAPNYPSYARRLSTDTLKGACPVVASYGGADRYAGSPAKARAVLTELGVEHDIREYPGARHSFMSHHDAGSLGPLVRIAGFGHDPAAAEDAWQRMLAFFDRHLRRPANGETAATSG